MCDLASFLVDDLNNSIVRVWYNTDNPFHCIMVMEEDVLKDWADNVGQKEAEEMGFYQQGSIIDLREYDAFTLRMYQEMARTHSEAPWKDDIVIGYFDFIETLDEAEMIEYNDSGVPYFKE